MMNLKKLLSLVFLTCYILTYSQVEFSEQSNAQNISVSHGSTLFVGGLSFFDFNGDGWDDLTYASEAGNPIYFYQNNNGIFSPININFIDYQNDTRQINWVDVDNDGDNDLFVVSNDAPNRLYENDGSMNFTDITAASGIAMSSTLYSWGASWGDYDNDGFLDLFLCNRDFANLSSPNQLYKNNGDNTFTDVSNSAGISPNNFISFCSAFFDYNNDGWQDIYIVNDRYTTENILYENNGNGTFTDVSAISGTGIAMDAMSTTIEDYNYDGWLDIYVTNTAAGNYFLRNNGDGTFTNIAAANGTAFYSIGWGAIFMDADNDKDMDLYVSGSGIGSSGQLPSAFYENVGAGTFTIPSNAGFDHDNAVSYSNAMGDINNDGYPDITVINLEPRNNFLWENNSLSNTNNNWLKVSLEGTTSNRMGIGSWIEIMVNGQKQYRYTLCGEGYISQNSNDEFFGLGASTTIDYVKVKWLSGVEDIIYNVSSNQELQIVESSTLSDQDQSFNNVVSVYPNPSRGKIQINVSNIFEPLTVELYDILGKQLQSNLKYINNDVLDLSFLTNGIYMLKISSGKSSVTRKIIINK